MDHPPNTVFSYAGQSEDGGAKLTEFEPHDPESAGCVVEVRTSRA